MKILCVCEQGNKRSVVTRFILNHTQHEALAMGTKTNSPETIKMLAEWADVILLAEPKMIHNMPVKYQNKVNQAFTIGPDIYKSGIDKHLYREVKLTLGLLGYL